MKSIPSELGKSNKKKEYVEVERQLFPFFVFFFFFLFTHLTFYSFVSFSLSMSFEWFCLLRPRRSCFTSVFALLQNRIPRQILSRVPSTKERKKKKKSERCLVLVLVLVFIVLSHRPRFLSRSFNEPIVPSAFYSFLFFFSPSLLL